jgi:hypothetical protein
MTREEFDAMAWQKGDRLTFPDGAVFEVDSVDFNNMIVHCVKINDGSEGAALKSRCRILSRSGRI